VYINPLINLVWWGGLILIVGTVIAAWPTQAAPAHAREDTYADGRMGAVA
jgi:cytochrome c biogenesis factor